MFPNQNYDSFQQQLNDLQRSYTQLGKTFPQQYGQQRAKREVHHEDGLDAARAWAKENLQPGEAENIFDSNENIFYCLSRVNETREGGGDSALLPKGSVIL